jgi:NAD(P)-dependent dehydrogenase (short-subunit alcohol dehydrogenase family)
MTAALAGRTAIVTGGSRGIGRAIALGLAADGARIVVCSRHQDGCDEVVAEIRAGGGEGLALAANVGDPDCGEQIVGGAMTAFGSVDVLVNNAATNPQFGPLIDADERAIQKILDVNLLGPLRLIRAACRHHMTEHGGSVINIASINGLQPEPMLGAYGASKAALIHMTRQLARELGPDIRVNAVAPGLIRTDFARALIDSPPIQQHFVERTPAGRIGEPSDVVAAVRLLAGDAAAFMTGSVITVDGGYTS